MNGTKRTKTAALAGMLLLACGLCGCEAAGFILYVFMPPDKTETVAPQYDGLAGKTVAVVVYADTAVQCDYPLAMLDVATAVGAELEERLEGITTIDPRRVIRYQRENVRWDSMDKTILGKKLSADAVLLIVLEEYAMREVGSVNLYRGRMVAHSSVYDASLPGHQGRRWESEEDIRILYPKDAPTGQPGRDDSRIRYNTHKQFAQTLVKCFYEHEVPKTK